MTRFLIALKELLAIRKPIRISNGGVDMKQGQWMLNGSYGGRWESITYFDTKEELSNTVSTC